MKYHKLLSRQLEKHISSDLIDQHPELHKFLDVISQSYDSLEKEKQLVERAFEISEDEYEQLNKRLSSELKKKKLSIGALTEAINDLRDGAFDFENDDIVSLANILKEEITNRKQAETTFKALTSNLNNGILLETADRYIVYSNVILHDIFELDTSQEALVGMDCRIAAELVKTKFVNPEAFVASIENCVQNRQIVLAEEFQMVNGRVFLRDYIPLYTDGEFSGHLWSYTEISETKAKEKLIAENERRNRNIMNAALDAIIVIDTQSKITFWNPQAEKVFGYTSEETMGKTMSSLIVPKQHVEGHSIGMQNYMDHGHGPVLNKHIELPALHKDGHEISIELYILPITEGENKYFCSFIKDITEKKQIQIEKDRLSLVASSNENGIMFLDQNDKVFWSNEGLSRMTAYTFDEISNTLPLEIFDGPLSRKDIRQKIYNDYKNKKSVSQELIFYRKDRSWFWARLKGQPLDSATGETYFFMIEDITEERKTQKILKEYEEKLKIALNSVGDDYWEHDFDLNKTTFLHPSKEFLGFNTKELGIDLAKFWWDRIHPEDKYIVEHLDKEYKSGKRKEHNVQYRVIKKDNSILWVIDRGTLIDINADGSPKKIIGTHIDITNQKKLETDLIIAKEAAESSTRSKEQFLANMSHEMRTPMNAIVGMANQLKKTPLTERQNFFVDTIQSSADNLLIIINDILDLSKIEAGELSLEKIGFEPKKVLGNVMTVMAYKAEEKGLSITNSYCDGRLSEVLIGDPYRLNQVFLNLISNAVKFTEKGGIDITCHVVEDHPDSQIVQGCITDTGIGMEPKFLERIFQKFKQEDDSVSRKFGGTGLGMSICKELIELMGGSIEVYSQKGKGTSVQFKVPLAKGTPNDLPRKERKNIDLSVLKGKKILVADDNEMNRLVATTILESYEVQVVEATDGKEAINLVKEMHPDLVLMDVQMPNMDGLEATKILREEYNKELPIVALTALALKGEERKFIAAGMNTYVLKPFQEHHLMEVIAGFFEHEATKTETIEIKPAPAPIQVENNSKLYSLEKLKTLSNGNEAFVQKMINLFVTLAPQSVSQINEAYQSGDFELVAKLAHKLKPSLDNMMITELKDTVREVEQNAQTYGKSEKLAQLVLKISEILTQVSTELGATVQV